jgi:hypothetical protein
LILEACPDGIALILRVWEVAAELTERGREHKFNLR